MRSSDQARVARRLSVRGAAGAGGMDATCGRCGVRHRVQTGAGRRAVRGHLRRSLRRPDDGALPLQPPAGRLLGAAGGRPLQALDLHVRGARRPARHIASRSSASSPRSIARAATSTSTTPRGRTSGSASTTPRPLAPSPPAATQPLTGLRGGSRRLRGTASGASPTLASPEVARHPPQRAGTSRQRRCLRPCRREAEARLRSLRPCD